MNKAFLSEFKILAKAVDKKELADLTQEDRETMAGYMRMTHAELRAATGVEGVLRASPRGFVNETYKEWVRCESGLKPVMTVTPYGESGYKGLSLAQARAIHDEMSNDVHSDSTLVTWDGGSANAASVRILILQEILRDLVYIRQLLDHR